MHRRGQNRIIEWKGRYVRLLFRRYRTGTRITRTLFAMVCGNAVLDSWMLLQAEVSPNLLPHCRLPGGGQTPGRSPTGAMLPQRPTGRAHPSHEISHLGAGGPHGSICTGFPAAKQADSRLATAIGCSASLGLARNDIRCVCHDLVGHPGHPSGWQRPFPVESRIAIDYPRLGLACAGTKDPPERRAGYALNRSG